MRMLLSQAHVRYSLAATDTCTHPRAIDSFLNLSEVTVLLVHDLLLLVEQAL